MLVRGAPGAVIGKCVSEQCKGILGQGEGTKLGREGRVVQAQEGGGEGSRSYFWMLSPVPGLKALHMAMWICTSD